MNIKRKSIEFFSTDPRVQSFFEKHGAHVRIEREVFFRDGSYGRCSVDGWESLDGADDRDKHERAKATYRYWQQVARAAQDDFEQLKEQLEHVPVVYGDADEELEELEKLQRKARRARRQLREAEAAVDESMPPKEKHRLALMSANAKQVQKFRDRLKKVKL